MPRSCCLLVLLGLAALAAAVSGYPTGAPDQACTNDQVPLHNPSLQPINPVAGSDGYTITVSNSTYTTPYSITVTISGTQPIMGFMVSVRTVAAPVTRVGNMVETTAVGQAVCGSQCPGATCALTHFDVTSKYKIAFVWTPPQSSGTGDVSIDISLVKEQYTYYRVSKVIPEYIVPTPPDVMVAPTVSDAVQYTDGTKTNTTVVLAWVKPFNGSNPILEYIVQIRVMTPTVKQWKHLWTGLAYSLVVNGLAQNTVYDFRIAANNTLLADWSPTLELTLPAAGAAPPSAPSAGMPTGTSTIDSLSVTWAPSTTLGAQFIGYQLEMKHSDELDAAYTVMYIGTNSNVTLTGLEPATEYTFRVLTKTLAGHSAYSTAFTASTYGSTCSGIGAFTPQGTCRCPPGALGLQCEITSRFSNGTNPCFGAPGQYCMDWATVGGLLYARIQGRITQTGWIAVGFGAEDGMTGAQIYLWTVPEQDAAMHQTFSSSGFVSPSPIASRLPAGNYSGFYNSTHLDIQFVRAMDTGVQGAFVIPATVGTKTFISWAVGSVVGLEHEDNDRGRASLDFQGTAADQTELVTNVSYTFYAPFVVALIAIVVFGLLFQIEFIRRSGFGSFLLHSRPSALCSSAEISQTSELTLPKGANVPTLGCASGLLRVLDVVTLDIRRTLVDWTWGEMICFFGYALGLIIAIAVGYNSYAVGASFKSHYIFGHLLALQFALTFLPVVRNSVWLWVLGISWERAIKFHRIIARITLLFIVIHLLSMTHQFGAQILTDGDETAFGKGVIYGFLAFLSVCGMAATAFEPVRRWSWELFLYSHLTLMPLAVLFACLHNVQVRYYLAIPLLLYVIDWAIRFANSARKVEIVSIKAIQGATDTATDGMPRLIRLEVALPSRFLRAFSYKPGDYCLLNIPSVSSLEWHPFSISSSPYSVSKDSMTFHILDMGRGSFTNRLANWLEASFHEDVKHLGDASHTVEHDRFGEGEGQKRVMRTQKTVNQLNSRVSIQFACKVDGPYGSLSVPLKDYSTIVLVAGGIGITPLYSILSSLLVQQNISASPVHVRMIHLIWVNRSPIAFTEWFPELLGTLYPLFHGMLRLHFFYTGKGSINGSAPVGEVIAKSQASSRAASRKVSAVVPIDVVPQRPAQTIERAMAPPPARAPPPAKREETAPAPSLPASRPSAAAPVASSSRSSIGAPPVGCPLPPPPARSSEAVPPPPPASSEEDVEVLVVNPAISPVVAKWPPPPPPGGSDSDESDEDVPGPPPPPPQPPQPSPGDDGHMSSAAKFAERHLEMSSAINNTLDSESYGDDNARQDKPVGPAPKVTIHTGRPAFSPLFDLIDRLHRRGGTPPANFVAPAQDKVVAVYACGPQELVDDAQTYSMAKGWHVHKETFKL